MKASELIELLAELKAKHGDLEVLCEHEEGFFVAEEIEFNPESPFNDPEFILR